MDGVKLSRTDNKRRRLCGAYNSKKGCTTPCPFGFIHGCNVIKPNGKVCEAKDHNSWTCPSRRG